MKIGPGTTIEEIAEQGSLLVKYLSDQGIRCIRCGEPIWGTLEEAAKQKGYTDAQIGHFVNEMNNIIENLSQENKL
jgi:methionine synthase II (cobalamin-independent)